MATYRPKSLNEINNFYDKTLTSRNAIKVSENAITAVTEQPAPVAESVTEEDALPAAASAGVGDLTADIQKFIQDFSNPEKQEDKPVPRTTIIKPAAVKPQTIRKNDKTSPSVRAEKKQDAPAEKPEIVMTAEKNELFEEYMRIMSDEDDDSFISRSKQKKKRKAKKHEDFSEAAEKSESSDELYSPESPVYQAEESFAAPEYTSDFSEPAIDEEDDEISGTDISFAEEPAKESKGKLFLQIFLIICLLVTLIAALGTTLINVVLKVNTGEPFAGKYYFYTVSKDDALVEIKKGDLLLAVEEEINDNEKIAYYNSDVGAYDFAVKRSDVGDNMTLAENSGSNGEINVFNTNIRGKLSKAFHFVGTVIGIATEHFTVILAVLMAVALILILILAFAFGRSGKKAKNYNDEDDDDLFTFGEDEENDETVSDNKFADIAATE